MSLVLLMLAQAATLAIDGPDLAEVEKAVGKCNADALARIYAAEPQRRRSATIAMFNEQQAIVAARRALGQRRLDALARPASEAGMIPVTALQSAGASNEQAMAIEAQALAERQQALDDARMLSAMRDSALDMMRQHYLTSCNSEMARGG